MNDRRTEVDVLDAMGAGAEIDWHPARLVVPGPWAGHIPFAFWLMKAARPNVLVELGVHTGNSYSAFCQAIEALGLPTQAFAVDTWQGDEHSGPYSEDVYTEFSRYNRDRYGAFSTLVRSTFDEARSQFSHGTIDVLHIDGMHTYDAVKHDFETWQDRLSDQAVVLFHDTNVTARDFGVCKLWVELARQFPSFEFSHSNGLGVLGVGKDLPPPVREFFDRTVSAAGASAVRKAMARRGKTFQDHAEVLAKEREILDVRTTLQQHISETHENAARHVGELRETIGKLKRELHESRTSADEARHATATQSQGLQQARDNLQRLSQELAERTHEVALVHDLYRRSTSWRVTGPMRRAIAMVRGRQPASHGRSNFTAVLADAPEIVQIGASNTANASSTAADFKSATRTLAKERLEAFLRSGQTLRLPRLRMKTPDVSIILILYNQAELTFACLTSIAECLASSDVSAEIVVLDNGSADATGELLSRVEGANILRSPENLHFLRGVNRAASGATGRHILLLNNDAQLVHGSIERAVKALDDDASIGAIGGRIILPDGRLQEGGSIIWADGTCLGYARGRPADASEAMFKRDVAYCSGAFLMTPRSVFEKLNWFDEAFAPAYYEETDYCVRLWEAGLRVVYDPSITIVHFEFGSAAKAEEALARQKHNHDLFTHTHRHWLEGQVPSSGSVHRARFARSRTKHILFIEDRVPKPMLGAGYPRANDILNEFQRQGAQVTLFPMWKHDETWSEVRRFIPDSVEVVLEGEASRLRAFLQERAGSFDAILVSRPHNMRVLRSILSKEPALQSGARLIYDAEALFSQRDILQARIEGRPLDDVAATELLKKEIDLVAGSDVVLSVSQLEADLFRAHGVENVRLLGHSVEIHPTSTAFADRYDILFLGAIHFDRSPNADSVLWFAENVLPHIRRELGQDIKLSVVGMVESPRVAALEGLDLTLLGRVDDLAPVFEKARVVVVPTRFAAGIAHKAHHAASLGVPIVSTEMIAKQLGWRNARDILASDDPKEFADHCVRLYRDGELWNRQRRCAIERVRAECSRSAFARSIRGLLEGIEPIGDGRPPEDSQTRHLYVQRQPETDYSIRVPLPFVVEADPQASAAAIVHLYYADQSLEFRRYLELLPDGSSVYISTDTEEKRAEISRAFAGFPNGPVEVRLAPNRGRDIAPKLITFRDVYDKHEFILHLHSKASEHTSALAHWRTYLLESLIGSREIVTSHLWVLQSAHEIGMIFPQHFDNVRRWIDWGVNFASARPVAERLGLDLRPDRALDFPSGSMFWARSAAFKPLLDLNLTNEEFPEEVGQKDATIAHAIERLYAMVAELAGFRWLKVARPELIVDQAGIVEVTNAQAFDTFVKEKTVCMTGSDVMPVSQELYSFDGQTQPALAEAAAMAGPAFPASTGP